MAGALDFKDTSREIKEIVHAIKPTEIRINYDVFQECHTFQCVLNTYS